MVADWLMESGRIDEGLDVLRLLKDEELYDFELRSAALPSDPPVSFTGDEQRLRERYSATLGRPDDGGAEFERLNRLRERNRLSPGERDALGRLLASQAASDAAQEKIGFEYVEGPVTPKPEKLPGARKRTAPRKPKPNAYA